MTNNIKTQGDIIEAAQEFVDFLKKTANHSKLLKITSSDDAVLDGYVERFKKLNKALSAPSPQPDAKQEDVDLVDLLNDCKKKLEIYYKQTNGEYSGGKESQSLIKRIETAIRNHEQKKGN